MHGRAFRYNGAYTVSWTDASGFLTTTAVADSPVTPPTVAPSESVGTIPGSPSVSGGAGAYQISLELPPGRGAMQPSVTLSYSSGNGIAGVGWSLSTGSTIYRCPSTIAQDGAGRPVAHDTMDMRRDRAG